MDLDQELARLLEESVRPLEPPVVAIVTEGRRLGRRRQLLRRLRTTGTVLTVTALAVTATAVGVSRYAGDPTHRTVAADPTAAATDLTAAPTGEAATAQDATAQPAAAQLTPDAMLKVLADLLPAHPKLFNYDPTDYGRLDPRQQVDMTVQYDDGGGASTVSISIRRAYQPFAPTDCDRLATRDAGDRPSGAAPLSCAITTLTDGGTELTEVTGADADGLYLYEVVVIRPDLGLVELTAENGTVNGSGAAEPTTRTRPRPPLDLAAWQAVAQSPRWRLTVPQSAVDAGAALAGTISRLPTDEG